MVISSIFSSYDESLLVGKDLDFFSIDWYESDKRILRKKTEKGIDIAIKRGIPILPLLHHDILLCEGNTVVLIVVKPCECIVIYPRNPMEIGTVCYDIGNKHIPISLNEKEIVLPFDKPTFFLLEKNGFELKVETRIFNNQLRNNIPQHAHQTDTLFDKLIKLTQ